MPCVDPLQVLGELDDMCYEERVLYRLLSGMHASTNIHISLQYFPPSKAAGRDNWEANPERFMQQVRHLGLLSGTKVLYIHAVGEACGIIIANHRLSG